MKVELGLSLDVDDWRLVQVNQPTPSQGFCVYFSREKIALGRENS